MVLQNPPISYTHPVYSEPLVIGRRGGCAGERFKRRNVWELITDANSPVQIQSRTSVV